VARAGHFEENVGDVGVVAARARFEDGERANARARRFSALPTRAQLDGKIEERARAVEGILGI
jgi:hypothetical protein